MPTDGQLTLCMLGKLACSFVVSWFFSSKLTFEPRHEISNNVVSATSKASDQPAHTGSLIRAVASRVNILRVLSY